MYCYRRRGHNEGDNPSFTHPLQYRVIEERPSVRESYLEHILELHEVSREEAEAIVGEETERLEAELEKARSSRSRPREEDAFGGVWAGYRPDPPGRGPEEVETGVAAGRLRDLLKGLTRWPEDFHIHPRLEKGFKQRREMAEGERPVDWAAAEALAFASLATEGFRVRLSGQDSERGTFSQRHAVLHDVENGRAHSIFSGLDPDQAPVEIFNSPLSEIGVLGFEYGYSLDYPEALIAWEAQFGDFVNAAQVIIDQFIASAEDKWSRLSGIVLLLPHGFEGQGPEHSSARLERWLLLSAEENIQVTVPSTAAQYFHLLRRQTLRRARKPLVILTPKSLLRYGKVASELKELEEGRFRRVLADGELGDREKVRRVLLCSGKIYYDLLRHREQLGRDDVAILRLEQLYPLPVEGLVSALAPYRDGCSLLWVQEEPRNMGAWMYLSAHHRRKHLFDRFDFSGVYRPESASPATGSKKAHELEQERLLDQAFGEA
jgi:2-oxoglutarate dehydrogenase E1 component